MSKGQTLRALVNERLTAAAEDIFALFERTIAEYEEELCRSKEENERKQQLLDSVLSPRVLLHRADVQTETPSQDEVSIVKEEPEELSISPESHHPPRECQYIPVIVKNEIEEAKSALLRQQKLGTGKDREDANDNWTQPWEPLAGSSTQQLETEDEEEGEGSDKVQIKDPKLSKMAANKSSQDRCALVIKKDVFLSELGDKLKRHNCPICGKTFKRDLWSHMLVHTGERPFSCSVCKKGFTRKSSLRLHMALHMREKPFSCPVCKRGFTQKAHLKIHMATHTKTVEKFLQLQQRQKKQQETVDQQQCLRSENDQNLEQTHSFLQHIAKEADVEYRCVYVKAPDQSRTSQNSNPSTKSRSRRANLEAESSRQAKGYDCTVCGKTFKGELWKHMLLHTGERPFSCSVCNKGFTRKSSLRAHMPIHTGERPYSCTICEKTFTQKVHLKTHLATHAEAVEMFLQLQQGQAEESRGEGEAELCGGAEMDLVLESQGDLLSQQQGPPGSSSAQQRGRCGI